MRQNDRTVSLAKINELRDGARREHWEIIRDEHKHGLLAGGRGLKRGGARH